MNKEIDIMKKEKMNGETRPENSARKNPRLIRAVIGRIKANIIAEAAYFGHEGESLQLIIGLTDPLTKAQEALQDEFHKLGGKLADQGAPYPYKTAIVSAHGVTPISDDTTFNEVDMFMHSVVKSNAPFIAVTPISKTGEMYPIDDESYKGLKKLITRFQDLNVYEQITFLRAVLKHPVNKNAFNPSHARRHLGMFYQSLRQLYSIGFMTPTGEATKPLSWRGGQS